MTTRDLLQARTLSHVLCDSPHVAVHGMEAFMRPGVLLHETRMVLLVPPHPVGLPPVLLLLPCSPCFAAEIILLKVQQHCRDSPNDSPDNVPES